MPADVCWAECGIHLHRTRVFCGSGTTMPMLLHQTLPFLECRVRLLPAAVVVALALPAAVVIPLNAAYAATPGPPYTAFVLQGAGRSTMASATLVLDSSNATVSASGTATRVVFSAIMPSFGHWWDADIAAPSGQNLAVGQTYDTARLADATHAGLDVFGDGRGCNTSTGSLTIKELTLDSGGNLAALAATFNFSCEGIYPLVAGELRWQSSIGYSAAVATPTSLSFGTATVGLDTAAQPVTLTSRGSDPVTIGTVSLASDASHAFSISSDTCSAVVLPPGGTCTVSVLAHPTVVTYQSAELNITTDTPVLSKTTVMLNVTGSPIMIATPSSLSFGTAPVGLDTAAQTATLTANGSDPVTIGAQTLTGDSPQAFSIIGGTCWGTTLSPGGSCTVRVVAHPTALTRQSAVLALDVWDNGTAAGQTTVPLDVTGSPNAIGTYYPMGSALRILDTRNGTGGPKAPIGPGGVLHLQVGGRGGVPTSGASAVVLNVTVTGPTTAGYLTVYPSGTTRPTASSLNFPAKWTGSNMVTVQLGTGGQVDIYNLSGDTQVVVDLSGFFAGDNSVLPTMGTGGDYQSVEPARLLDTRTSTGAVPPGGYAQVPVDFGPDFNAHVRALAVNITEVNAPVGGYLTAWNGADALPSVSTVNFDAKTITPNMAVVPTSMCSDDYCRGLPQIGVYNGAGASVQVIVDLFGFFDDGTLSDGLVFHPMSPTRIVDSRSGLGISHALGANSTATVAPPESMAGIDTEALAMNVTAVSPTSGTYLTVWPTGVDQPAVSNLNPAAGATVSNSVWSFLGAGDTFNVYNRNGSVNIVVDVFGTFDRSPLSSYGVLAKGGNAAAKTPAPLSVQKPSLTATAAGATLHRG